ncbi:hypothetical protein [uncultured Roseovarius sp.]|uniref:hypothetical protein n=1 Tax=uncultured Roseovarius sp. TaxID=293344 RepID=UPI00260CC388|nr:hypothetical protein [uncultured Roseovarius sp.]
MTDSVFKLAVAGAMEIDEVIAAADAVPGQTCETAEIRGVELQRIDRAKETTVVFFTSGEESARAFQKVVEKSGRKARVDKADPKELLSSEPVQN